MAQRTLFGTVSAKTLTVVEKQKINHSSVKKAISTGNWQGINKDTIYDWFLQEYRERYNKEVMLGLNKFNFNKVFKELCVHYNINTVELTILLNHFFHSYHKLQFDKGDFRQFNIQTLKTEWIMDKLMKDLPRYEEGSNIPQNLIGQIRQNGCIGEHLIQGNNTKEQRKQRRSINNQYTF